jgi:hypothetical protein
MGDETPTNPDPLLTGDTDAMAREILHLRDLLRGAEAQVGELETRLDRLDAQRAHSERLWIERLDHTDRQHDAAQQQLTAIQQSRSWRIGQLILSPVAAWRRIISS